MGKKWDYQVPSVEFWKEALRVLKPGGHVLSFCGTRTYHRMVVNIEDAGFEIRDCIQWIYGSGFPKSLSVSKSIDSKMGLEPVITGEKISPDGIPMSKRTPNSKDNYHESHNVMSGATKHNIYTTIGNSNEAQQWDGWGTALKPANEPICVARKPIEGTVADNVMKYGTGGINIDGCRIEGSEGDDPRLGGNGSWQTDKGAVKNVYQGGFSGVPVKSSPLGRFPANVIFDEEAAKILNQQTGNLISGKPSGVKKASNNVYGKYGTGIDVTGYGDSGGASRFFYVAKASKSERNYGLIGFEEKQIDDGRIEGNPGGDNPRNRGVNKSSNFHPTVKPISLMRYLVRLVTPPNGIVLDPFCGSGTTGISCKLEDFNFVGLEMDEEYCAIAKSRILSWTKETDIYDKAEKEVIAPNQTALF